MWAKIAKKTIKNVCIVFIFVSAIYILEAKIFQKKFQKYLVVQKKCYTFVLWRGGRVVDCGGLENR